MTIPTNTEKTFTAADVADAFRAGLELGQRASRPADDAGFAERFLENRRTLRLAQVADVLDTNDPAPTGLDPATIAAARSIARALNGGVR